MNGENDEIDPSRNRDGSDVDPAVNPIALPFSADPVAHWFFPEPQQYAKYFPGFVKAFVGAALRPRHGRPSR